MPINFSSGSSQGRQCPSLAYLDLRENEIGDEGAERLAAVLGQCPSLAHLNFEGNGIEAEGSGMPATLLQQYPSFSHLDLEGSGIGAEGAGRLAAVLGQCPLLSHLEEIEISDEVAWRLAAVQLPSSPFICWSGGVLVARP